MANRNKNLTKAENDFKFDYNNDAGKIGAKILVSVCHHHCYNQI